MSGTALAMLCAWCEQQGQAHGAERAAAAAQWRAVPLSYVRAHWNASTHGICPWCVLKVEREWEAERELRARARDSASRRPVGGAPAQV